MTHTAQIQAAHRLTPMQSLMLLHSLAEPASTACFVQYSLRVYGPFDPQRYRVAWQDAVDRHTALRTCFAWRGLDEPLQVVFEGAQVPVTLHDWTAGPPADPEAAVRGLAEAEALSGFDLTVPPLVRLVIIRMAEGVHHILIGMHHLVVDGWSVERLLAETAAGYREPGGVSTPATDFGAYPDWIDAQDPQSAAAAWRSADRKSVV